LRTIFLDKNMGCYCRYIDLNSFVTYRLANDLRERAARPPSQRVQLAVTQASPATRGRMTNESQYR
jgi:hypothetical protein